MGNHRIEAAFVGCRHYYVEKGRIILVVWRASALAMIIHFHLLDLVSQASVIQRLLGGMSIEEKISWLSAHGKVTQLDKKLPEWPDTYHFESTIGIQCAFVIKGDDFLFVGDNHFFTVPVENAFSE